MLRRPRPSVLGPALLAVVLAALIAPIAVPAPASAAAVLPDAPSSGAASSTDDDIDDDGGSDDAGEGGAPTGRPWVDLAPPIEVGTSRAVYLSAIDSTMTILVRRTGVTTGCLSHALTSTRVVLGYDDGATLSIPCLSTSRTQLRSRSASDAAIVRYWVGPVSEQPPAVGAAAADQEEAAGQTEDTGDDVDAAGKTLVAARRVDVPFPARSFDPPLTAGQTGEYFSTYLVKTVSVEVLSGAFRIRCQGVAAVVVIDAAGTVVTARCRPDGLPIFHFQSSASPVTRIWVGPPSATPPA